MKTNINNIKEYISGLKDKEALLESKKAIMEALDAQEAYVDKLQQGAKVYSNGFGYIKEAFESISPDLYKTKNGRAIMQKYIKTIKEDKNLKNLYSLYEGVFHAKNGVDANYFLNESLKLMGTIDEKKLAKSVEKAGRILNEGCFAENIDIPEIYNEINESIDYLATTEKKMNNMAEYSTRYNNVVKFIKENAGKNVRTSAKNSGKNLSEAINEFNEKHKDLEKDEIDIVSEIAYATNKNAVFEKYKNACLSALKESISKNPDNANYESLNEVYSMVDKKKFNENTIGEDVANFIKLQNRVNED